MSNKSDNQQSAIISEIKKVERSIRTEIKKTEKVLREEILRVEERLEKTEYKLNNKMDTQHDEVMTSVSNFAGRVETLETENAVGADQIHELRETTKDHEKRIAKLESSN